MPDRRGTKVEQAVVLPGAPCWVCGEAGHWKSECSYRGSWVASQADDLECFCINTPERRPVSDLKIMSSYKIGHEAEFLRPRSFMVTHVNNLRYEKLCEWYIPIDASSSSWSSSSAAS